MCEYCDFKLRNRGKYIYKDGEDDMYIEKEINDNKVKYCIIANIFDGIGAEIKYCPMCGRELKK